MYCSSKIKPHWECEKKKKETKPSIKHPLFSLVSKHLDKNRSHTSQAVKSRGDLDTANQFFKVIAKVWKSPELSEQCGIWGISAEKPTFQRGQSTQKHHPKHACVWGQLKIRFLKWNLLSSSLSKGTSNKCGDLQRPRWRPRARKETLLTLTHTALFPFSPVYSETGVWASLHSPVFFLPR